MWASIQNCLCFQCWKKEQTSDKYRSSMQGGHNNAFVNEDNELVFILILMQDYFIDLLMLIIQIYDKYAKVTEGESKSCFVFTGAKPQKGTIYRVDDFSKVIFFREYFLFKNQQLPHQYLK